jgi:hypothetical protein
MVSSVTDKPGQGDLFNEVEDILNPDEKEVAAEQHVAYTRKTPRRARLDASLPRKEVIHDISDDDKTCECCGTDMHRMGEDVSEKLDFIPAKMQVTRHIRPLTALEYRAHTLASVILAGCVVYATLTNILNSVMARLADYQHQA